MHRFQTDRKLKITSVLVFFCCASVVCLTTTALFKTDAIDTATGKEDETQSAEQTRFTYYMYIENKLITFYKLRSPRLSIFTKYKLLLMYD